MTAMIHLHKADSDNDDNDSDSLRPPHSKSTLNPASNKSKSNIKHKRNLKTKLVYPKNKLISQRSLFQTSTSPSNISSPYPLILTPPLHEENTLPSPYFYLLSNSHAVPFPRISELSQLTSP